MSRSTANSGAAGLRATTRPVHWLEVLAVLAVFAVQGGWQVPDVNEAHYLTGAKAYWDAGWVQGDIFLDSSPGHPVFYATLGWLTRVTSLPITAWTLRLLCWLLLAWGWCRVARQLVPVAGMGTISAAVAACLWDRAHLAGEWVVGGIEAKTLAYALVCFGLAELLRDRWNRTLIWMGAAAAFHPLVGGWSLLAAGFAWCLGGYRQQSLWSLWPGLSVAALLASLGVIPALALTSNVPTSVINEAHDILVYRRLSHHLYYPWIPWAFRMRQLELILAWAGFAAVMLMSVRGKRVPWRRQWRLQAFTAGSLLLVAMGIAATYGTEGRSPLQAGLIRFYWFRLADVMLPVGFAFAVVGLSLARRRRNPWVSRLLLSGCVLVGGLHLADQFQVKRRQPVPRSFKLGGPQRYDDWRDACRWIESNTPREARFITPQASDTFKWYTGRAEVANWKDVPQDAQSAVRWWHRLVDLHYDPRYGRWVPSLTWRGSATLEQLGQKYQAGYLLVEAWPPLDLPQMYHNDTFAVYRLRQTTP